MTKVALGAASLDHLSRRLADRTALGPLVITTRFLPKRHDEIAGAGSLYWIVKHQLVARSAIERFGEAEGGRVAIHLAAGLVVVRARPKRAHQGWRYLEAADAPADLVEDATGLSALPAVLLGRLAELALV